MLINPNDLAADPDRLEEIERASLRLITQALVDFRATAQEIYLQEGDLVADIGEDITREALDRLGMSKIDQRLFGKIDYKRARYVFHPAYAVKQALFVDSKAEKMGGRATATLQTSQLSMTIKQVRAGQQVEVQGKLPAVLDIRGDLYLTTTIFVKYDYEEAGQAHALRSISVAGLPNGLLQARYNPTFIDTIWLAGRNAPTLGEEFRVRLSLPRLKRKAAWRVQNIPMPPEEFHWQD
jgi:hypothetical protein